MKLIINKVIKKQINSLEGNLQLLDDKSIEKAVNIILQSKKVTFFGVGSSGITACQASSSMLRIGINCDYKQDSHFQAMSASLLTKEDCVIGMSVSGSTKDTIYNLEIAKKAGAKIICITNNGEITNYKACRYCFINFRKGKSIGRQFSSFAISTVIMCRYTLYCNQ